MTALNFVPSIDCGIDTMKRLLPTHDLKPVAFNRAPGKWCDLAPGPFPREFDLSTFLSCSTAIVSRYHAIQFAIQTGRPFLAISYDNKVSRFLVDNNLSHLEIKLQDINTIPERLKDLCEQYDEAMETLRDIRTRLCREGDSLAEEIRKNVARWASSPVPFSTRLKRRLSSLAP